MALFDHERKNGIQLGTVGDECMECKVKHKHEEDYEPPSLDYQYVYKFWINNLSHCMCMDCFKETLGKHILVDPDEIAEEKPKAAKKAAVNTTKKKDKEDDKNGSETTQSS